MIDNPSSYPDPSNIVKQEEPFVDVHLYTPNDYVGALMDLCQQKRGVLIDMKYLDDVRVDLHYALPLGEIVYDFFDAIKSRSRGYASYDYEFKEYRESDLVKLDFLLNGDPVDALSMIVFRDNAYAKGRRICEKLRDNIPRTLFEIPVQAAIGVLAVVLAALIVWMMVLVSGIQGTARVVNYAGLVRGETQRLVKMEIAGQAENGMMESVESFINGLRFGDDELTLVRLGDKSFQTKMEELASCFESLKQEIYLVREKGFEKTDIIDKSEKFFDICDEATCLAETYSQKRASSLAVLERYITADIVVLMMLIGYELSLIHI